MELKPQKNSERGIALILAILIIAMIVSFATDQILKSQVDLELVVISRDGIKAEYSARSALNMAKFLITVDLAVDLTKKQMIKEEPVDHKNDIWSKMNGIPFGGETVELLDGFKQMLNLRSKFEDKFTAQLKTIPGFFSFEVEDEQGKININYAAQGRGKEVIALLTALGSCAAEQEYFKDKDIDFEAITYRIKDWVDADKRAEAKSGYGGEDDPYQDGGTSYQAKNAPFDSIDELMLIDGWDEELHAIFSPYITVFPVQVGASDKPKMNLNTIPKELMGCLFPEAKQECKKNFYESYTSVAEDKTPLAVNKNEISKILRSVFCENGKGAGKDFKNLFTTTSEVFRVRAVGEVGDQKRVIQAIISRQIPNPAKKIEKATKYLYWKKI